MRLILSIRLSLFIQNKDDENVEKPKAKTDLTGAETEEWSKESAERRIERGECREESVARTV